MTSPQLDNPVSRTQIPGQNPGALPQLLQLHQLVSQQAYLRQAALTSSSSDPLIYKSNSSSKPIHHWRSQCLPKTQIATAKGRPRLAPCNTDSSYNNYSKRESLRHRHLIQGSDEEAKILSAPIGGRNGQMPKQEYIKRNLKNQHRNTRIQWSSNRKT